MSAMLCNLIHRLSQHCRMLKKLSRTLSEHERIWTCLDPNLSFYAMANSNGMASTSFQARPKSNFLEMALVGLRAVPIRRLSMGFILMPHPHCRCESLANLEAFKHLI